MPRLFVMRIAVIWVAGTAAESAKSAAPFDQLAAAFSGGLTSAGGETSGELKLCAQQIIDLRTILRRESRVAG
jgi:hypothetical protein